MGVGAICTFAALLGLALTVAELARRVHHEVRATAAEVERLRRVRQAMELLRAEASSTRVALDDTGDSVGYLGRR